MRPKQAKPKHIKKIGGKKRLYSPSALTNAYKLVKEEGLSVRRAALTCNVPESTLRDRTMGIVSVDTLSAGTPPLFKPDEEVTLVNHLKKIANMGYGYTRQECVDIATDYAIQIGKRSKDRPLTKKWFRGFIKRWPELKTINPRSLDHARAKMASADVVQGYFDNLKETLEKHDLLEKPHLVFNVAEKGITVEHKPPLIVESAKQTPAVTSWKGKTITMLGCGSAAGQAIPPYFLFPGKRMRQDLLQGATAGAHGAVSETGSSNGLVFRKYLETHFLKHVPSRSNEKILLVMDGHKAHVSVGLYEWAFEHGIVIFMIPPHCSKILQPMDAGCFEMFQQLYNTQCHKRMIQMSAVITRYDVCKIACQIYAKALSAEIVQSAFRRTGIYPLNSEAVQSKLTMQAEDVCSETSNESGASDVRSETSNENEASDTDTDIVADDTCMFEKKGKAIKKKKK